jgi:protocatechuate 3,4-dioxygenase beta subunit
VTDQAARRRAPVVLAGAALALLAGTAVLLLLKTPVAPEPAIGPREEPRRLDPASREAEPEPAPPLARISPKAFVDPEQKPQSGTGAVTGQVLLADGSPAESVFVFCGPADSISFLGYEESLRDNLAVVRSPESRPAGIQTGLTDASGAFSFLGVKPAWKLTVAAWHPEFGLVSSRGILIRAGETPSVALRFPSHVRFTGYVTEPDGRPIAGAQVEVTARQRLETVETDAEGRYETSHWPGADFALKATNYEHYDDSRSVRAVGPTELERHIDFQLVRARKVTGRLVLADGSPAKVQEHVSELKDPEDPDWRFGLFSSYYDPRERGRYVWPKNLGGRIVERDDTYELVIKSPKAAWIGIGMKSSLLGAAPIPSDLSAPGPDLVVDWSLAPKPVRRGALVVIVRSTADSTPVTRYTLYVDGLGPEGSDRACSQFEVKTPDGRYLVERLREGRHRVSIAAPGFAPASKETEVVAGRDDNEVVVNLSPSLATITGLVLGPGGKPVQGALVSARPGNVMKTVMKHVVPMPSTNFLREPVRTDSTGAFRFEGLQMGTYRVTADAEGLARGWAYASPQPVENDVIVKLEEGVPVEILPEGSTGPFFLFVTERESQEDVFRSIPDPRPSGERLVLRVKPGTYDVSLSAQGFQRATGTIKAVEGASLRLKLTPTGDGTQPESR